MKHHITPESQRKMIELAEWLGWETHGHGLDTSGYYVEAEDELRGNLYKTFATRSSMVAFITRLHKSARNIYHNQPPIIAMQNNINYKEL